jgi:hypothetical protein
MAICRDSPLPPNGRRWFFAVVLGLTLGACSQPSDTTQSAQQPTTADRAHKDADEKAWAEAKKTDTVAAFTSYLQNFGSGTHTAEASRRIVALIDQARKDADDKAWTDAEKVGTAAAFNTYLQSFGSGAHVAEARQRIAALDEQTRKEADEKAWADAVRTGTAAAFNTYLQSFGSGAHAAEARQRIAALEVQGGATTNSGRSSTNERGTSTANRKSNNRRAKTESNPKDPNPLNMINKNLPTRFQDWRVSPQ